MKKYTIYIFGLLLLSACAELDVNPLSEGSSENWYSNETEVTMALNDLYREVFWFTDDDSWTDDWTSRGATTPITNATVNGEWGTVSTLWTNSYKAIARANTVLQNLDRIAGVVPQETIDRFEGEARFIRASMYANLVNHFGDVVYYQDILELEDAFSKSRTEKESVLQGIYEDFDIAIAQLPVSYGGSELQRATKGAALALKARTALYQSDWQIAADAAKACMDLGIYELYPDYGALFLANNKNSAESIFAIPRSVELDVALGSNYPVRATITRNAGGWSAYNPSWDLFCAYLCTDGLPIDESPLFDPHDPFANRDPRLAETIVPFGAEHLGFIYQPHPDTLQVLNLNAGKYQTNNDSRGTIQWASWNGLVWRKGVDEDWSDDRLTDPEKKIVRYADVLLMYAEASIELGNIDQSVLDAINAVRARAYGLDPTAADAYPAVTTTDQTELRKLVRLERRTELALEDRRYMDIIRWELADKVLNNDIYGMLDVAELREKVVAKDLWFFPEVPPVDEDGVADFTPMYEKGLIKLLADRAFDESRQYLWPIPTKEILINSNMRQNPGY
ncbi:RagB/SusD family nutrient uptake outer membrane protein [Flavilitoribacter nigricans]|uniref:RagB/SusD family nutrient uptake outer membrane protein n=1 Tax=Flavilitoribacter nigricans (strain ATCC 23147 / DSM 23189 / NBRC 102662 / NCIMB 1420 / SS-2) TaxID=1122177 RepID=A0A2D0NCH3_FLAN2|nr:RagB/SusD family nutrient uptake outer membrane protein [Flavilitoribacter nigricans]PHN06098.1 RagB/SusD family nutrient uptake outer membrane protein [Flavilitoribacter nigricans DSM 23189 = NBRC 102662]